MTEIQDGEAATLHFVEGINKFLTALPQRTLKRLFESPSNCLVIFRLLPAFARHIILNLLWVAKEVSTEDLQSLLRRSDGKRILDSAIASLEQVHVVSLFNDNVMLDSAFRTNFQRALIGGGDHQSFGTPSEGSVEVSIAHLDQYATEKWETILHYMVGSELPEKPSPSVLGLLKKSSLMDSQSARSSSITSRGFQFLLEDVNKQLWDLLLSYLAIAEEKELDMVEVLTFLFMLGSMQLGQSYLVKALSATQREVLGDLADYGLIYQPSKTSSIFYPTRLATTLTSSAPPLLSSAHVETEKGYLLVETNYRVYGYTSNPLQIAVLNLFISMKARFPNLVIGSLTRDSVKSALKKGITSDQIIAFLNAHAHPQMRKQEPLLPPTVSDQIRLWELEKNRIVATPGMLMDEFRAASDFKLVRDYASDLGVITWEADPNAIPPKCWRFFVTDEGYPPIREFIRRRTQQPS